MSTAANQPRRIAMSVRLDADTMARVRAVKRRLRGVSVGCVLSELVRAALPTAEANPGALVMSSEEEN